MEYIHSLPANQKILLFLCPFFRRKQGQNFCVNGSQSLVSMDIIPDISISCLDAAGLALRNSVLGVQVEVHLLQLVQEHFPGQVPHKSMGLVTIKENPWVLGEKLWCLFTLVYCIHLLSVKCIV
jgi:hypothetical protein